MYVNMIGCGSAMRLCQKHRYKRVVLRIWRRFCDAPEVKTTFAVDEHLQQLSDRKHPDLQQLPGGCLWATLLSGIYPHFHHILTKKTQASGGGQQDAVHLAIVLPVMAVPDPFSSAYRSPALPQSCTTTGIIKVKLKNVYFESTLCPVSFS